VFPTHLPDQISQGRSILGALPYFVTSSARKLESPRDDNARPSPAEPPAPHQEGSQSRGHAYEHSAITPAQSKAQWFAPQSDG